MRESSPLANALMLFQNGYHVRLSHAVKLSLFSHSHGPTHPITVSRHPISTPNGGAKECMHPSFPASSIYTPANVCPTISLPHNAPSSCLLRAIQSLNSSMVMLALASFHSILPGW